MSFSLHVQALSRNMLDFGQFSTVFASVCNALYKFIEIFAGEMHETFAILAQFSRSKPFKSPRTAISGIFEWRGDYFTAFEYG